MVRLAEDVGFDTVWVEDHALIRLPPPGRSDPTTRGGWEGFALLGALAAVTERIRLGPFVACAAFRNPLLLAKAADTLDEISGGRLILGLGAGWHQPEFEAMGLPFDHRVARFAEALHVVATLLRDGRVDFQGTYHSARGAELRPRGPRPAGPPIWVGAEGDRMLEVAARYADAVNTAWHPSPDAARPAFERLAGACVRVGRDPASVARTVGCHVVLRVPVRSVPNLPVGAIDGGPTEVAERLAAFFDAGVEHVTVTLAPWRPATVEGFGKVLELLG